MAVYLETDLFPGLHRRSVAARDIGVGPVAMTATASRIGRREGDPSLRYLEEVPLDEYRWEPHRVSMNGIDHFPSRFEVKSRNLALRDHDLVVAVTRYSNGLVTPIRFKPSFDMLYKRTRRDDEHAPEGKTGEYLAILRDIDAREYDIFESGRRVTAGTFFFTRRMLDGKLRHYSRPPNGAIDFTVRRHDSAPVYAFGLCKDFNSTLEQLREEPEFLDLVTRLSKHGVHRTPKGVTKTYNRFFDELARSAARSLLDIAPAMALAGSLPEWKCKSDCVAEYVGVICARLGPSMFKRELRNARSAVVSLTQTAERAAPPESLDDDSFGLQAGGMGDDPEPSVEELRLSQLRRTNPGAFDQKTWEILEACLSRGVTLRQSRPSHGLSVDQVNKIEETLIELITAIDEQ